MKKAKKVFNVLGIIAAWFLTFALVLMLLLAPVLMSMMSLMNPQTITQAVTAVFSSAAAPAPAQPQQSYGMVHLSSKTGSSAQAAPNAEDILGDLDLSAIEDLIGEEIDPEVVEKILESNAAKEFIETYTEDITNAFTGGSGEMQMDADKIIEIVENNMDEIVEIIQEVAPDLTEEDIKEIKKEIKAVVKDNAEDIADALPKPDEFREEMLNTNPELEMAFALLANLDTIKMVIVGIIVALSLLIFLCRLPGLRGFRWLATILFVAGGLNAVTCIGLLLGSTVLMTTLSNEPMLASLGGLVESLLSSFTMGMLARTGVMLGSAVVLLVIYILIKKARKNKLAKAAPVVKAAPAAKPVAAARPANAPVARPAAPADKPAAAPVAKPATAPVVEAPAPVVEEAPAPVAEAPAPAAEETPAVQPEAEPVNAE